jgi:hypothetical protein
MLRILLVGFWATCGSFSQGMAAQPAADVPEECEPDHYSEYEQSISGTFWRLFQCL